MEPEQMMEWGLMRDRAIDHLRHCHHVSIAKHRPIAQFLILPSFDDSISIDLVRTGSELRAYITRWRATHDIEAFATPVERMRHPRPFLPTYESHQVPATQDQLCGLINQIQQITVSLVPTGNSISLDGTSYEFNSGNGYSGVRLRWHNQIPLEWSVLTAITKTMVGMLECVSENAT
jgi:hypothetical protein